MWNSWKSSSSFAFITAKSLLNKTPDLLSQQTRTTTILKRREPLRLHKKGKLPPKFNKNCFYYEVIERTHLKPPPPIDIILTQFVQGYGEKGDRLTLKAYQAYNHFLLPGLAIYASPENIEKYLNKDEKKKGTFSSMNAPITLKYLQQCILIVKMSIDNPWILEKWHIRANFRARGIIVTDEAIEMPKKEISGPNLDNEGKEFYVNVRINKTEITPVRCKLHHDTFDLTKQLPEVKHFWNLPGEMFFSEDEEVLNTIPKPKLDSKNENKEDQ